MKKRSYKEMARQLYETASAHGGYFTAKEALKTGYAKSTHSYNVGAGNWIREMRGIYRLANYPMPSRPDLIEWWLWSSDRKGEPQAVFSHETALTIYDLSDVNPARIHMTVPPNFRRFGPISKVLRLHRGTVRKEETENREGHRVTKPLRTIVDLMQEGTIQQDHLRQAVRQAFQRGLISTGELARADRVPPEIRDEIERMRKG